MKRVILFIFLTFSFYNCSCKRNKETCSILESAVSSGEFNEFLSLGIKEPGTAIIYNSTDSFQNCREFKISDSLNIRFEKSNFKLEVNESRFLTNPKIVLYKFEHEKSLFKFYFFYTELNSTLRLNYSENGELVDYSRGVF